MVFKIRTAEECKQKAFLIAEGKKAKASDVRIFFQGNVVDQAMRRRLSMDHPPMHWMAQYIDQIMDETEAKVKEEDGVLRWKHRDDRKEVRQFCYECVMRLEPILGQLILPYEYQPALRFSTKMNIPGLDDQPTPILLVGEMDVLTCYKPPLPDIEFDQDPIVRALWRPEYRVWDLKVTKDASYWRKTAAQLVFYDIVCSCMFGVPTVEVGLIQPMVEGYPWISFRPSEEDRTQMYTRIVSVAQAIMRADHSPKADSTGCSYCETRNACVKYAPEPGTKTMPLF
jgi:hypothetical protein